MELNRVFTIYKITCSVNNKVYIGQTKQKLKDRLTKHRSDAKLRSGTCFASAIKKYGWDSFKIQTMSVVSSQEEANLLEQKLIEENNSIAPNGYNIHSGGHSGFLLTDEKKKQRSESQKLVCKKTKVTSYRNGIYISFNSIYEAADYHQISPCRVHDALKRKDRTSAGVCFIKPSEFGIYSPYKAMHGLAKTIVAVCKKTGTEIAISSVSEVTKIGACRSVIAKCLKDSKKSSGGYYFREISLEEFYNHPNKLLTQ